MEEIYSVGINTNLNDLFTMSQMKTLGLAVKISLGYSEFPILSPFSTIYCIVFPRNTLTINLFSHSNQLSTIKVPIESLINNPEQSFSIENKPELSNFCIKFVINLLTPQSQYFHKQTDSFSQDFNAILNEITETISNFSQFFIKNEIFLNNFKDFGLNLSFLLGNSAIDPEDFEYFKGIILGLNEKLKVLQCVEIILKGFEESCKLSEEARERLLVQLDSNSREYSGVQDKQNEYLKNVSDAINSTNKELTEKQGVIKDQDQKITDLTSINTFNESKILAFKAQNLNFDYQVSLISSLQSQLASSETEKFSLRCDLESLTKKQQLINDEFLSELKDLQAKNETLNSTLTNLQNENFAFTNIIIKLESEQRSKDSKIRILESELSAYKHLEEKLVQCENLLKTHQEICIKTYDQVTTNTSKFNEFVNILNQEKMKLLQSSADMQLKYSKLDQQFKTLTDRFKAENIILLENKTKLAVLSQYDTIIKDSKTMTKSLLNVYSQYNRSKEVFVKDLGAFVKIHVMQTKTLLVINRCIEKIRGINKEKDCEIEVLQDVLTELQKKIPYLPVKDDDVDVALAEYVNSLPSPLAVPFVREDSGIYLFGSKKVFVKIDNGIISSINYLVRVGGGSILVDEFIQMYTESELSKLGERRRKKSPNRSSIVGKIINYASNS